MYIARIYEKIINRKKTYQKKLEKIPYPEFIVLYNGDKPYPEHKELRLSSAFKNADDLKGKNKELPLELVAQVYNINLGHNEKILKKSETLDNYSSFIDKIRDYQKEGFSLAEAVDFAIEYCIGKNKLKCFLDKHGSEVRNMLMTEYNRDEEMEVVREEAWEDGLERGREEGRERLMTTARNALAEGFPNETVHKITGLDMAVIEAMSNEGAAKGQGASRLAPHSPPTMMYTVIHCF
jgi:hypothetical protein